ncbi:hypothetical protein H257_16012 [Aphanomyces astaci]|uniref:Uncharacterized protein n=1 Tax=Aphanomyces astaci TaxID=112090 RepID=W4FK48_APHAT|nr:hypothetical protein H257_16012 [Aphanomyces astaci]ETV67887.1 hypothetical protein H257_16012 [Aphanomyces astaci]|eukprot:XP_009842632.1 hypothetical protein H257_16012 [Aphanomyces astaci]
MDVVEAAVKSVPPHLRKTFAMLAASSGNPSTTDWRVLQTKKLQCQSRRLKPMVTERHKADRVEFVRLFVHAASNVQMRWDDMLDRVHIDEKWFYLTLVNPRYYLWHDEAVPVRKRSSKRHIIKVMFLTAEARPRFEDALRKMWDGKIGMWPFVSVVPAQRKSKNRERGTPVAVTGVSAGACDLDDQEDVARSTQSTDLHPTR